MKNVRAVNMPNPPLILCASFSSSLEPGLPAGEWLKERIHADMEQAGYEAVARVLKSLIWLEMNTLPSNLRRCFAPLIICEKPYAHWRIAGFSEATRNRPGWSCLIVHRSA